MIRVPILKMTSPLISTSELKQMICGRIPGTSGHLVILDAGANLGDNRDPYTELYLTGHIPSARYFNMDEGVTSTPTLSRSLPDVYSFVKQLRKLGINNDSKIVVYDHSAKPYNASRLRWTLKMYGCPDVRLLDGGIKKWKNDGYDVTTEVANNITAGKFVATVTDEMARDIDDVRTAVELGISQIVDSRERVNFTGAADHSPSLPGGHIPGSLNIPTSELFQADGTFKLAEDIEQLFENAQYDRTKSTIGMCRTGMTICSLVTAAELIGIKNIPVYNGSWFEWEKKEPNLKEVDIVKGN